MPMAQVGGVAFTLALAWASQAGAQTVSLADYFPLRSGASWTYEGVVSWGGAPGTAVRRERMRWRMEVLDTVVREHFSAALVRGDPADLMFYQPGRRPSEYVVVPSGGWYFQAKELAGWGLPPHPEAAAPTLKSRRFSAALQPT
jgi:hypothetical protein